MHVHRVQVRMCSRFFKLLHGTVTLGYSRLVVEVQGLLHVVGYLWRVSHMALHSDCYSTWRLRCFLEEIKTTSCRVQLLLLVAIHLPNCLLRMSIISLEVEAIPFWHVLDPSWCIARRNANGIARLLHLRLITALKHVLSPDIARDLVMRLPLLHIAQVLIWKVVVVGNGVGERWLLDHVGSTILRHLLDLDLLGIMRLPCKHKLPTHLVSLICRPLIRLGIATIFFHLFNPISIAKRVKGMLSAWVGRTDICNHSRSTVSGEGVSEYFRKLTSSEW